MGDERKGVEAAQLFSQKEFENIYLISGGFDAFIEQYPELLEGKKAAFYQAKAKKAPKPAPVPVPTSTLPPSAGPTPAKKDAAPGATAKGKIQI
jgi:hypothetical protein